MKDETATLLDIDDIARLLKVSRATVYRRTLDGMLPKPMKFGRSARWRPADILAVIDSFGQEDR